jgi:hypothetical protein
MNRISVNLAIINAVVIRNYFGHGEIRTPGLRKKTPSFKPGTFNRSATCPTINKIIDFI